MEVVCIKKKLVVAFLFSISMASLIAYSSKSIMEGSEKLVDTQQSSEELFDEIHLDTSSDIPIETVEDDFQKTYEVIEPVVEVVEPAEQEEEPEPMQVIDYTKYINVINDGVSDSAVQGVRDYLAMIPVSYMELLDIDVIVTNDIDASLSGVYKKKENTIYIRATKDSYSYTVIHEVAHALDVALFTPSTSGTFVEIYNKEKDNFKSTVKADWSHDISTIKEYYASAFQEFILNPDQLKENCPETYEFMDTSFN